MTAKAQKAINYGFDMLNPKLIAKNGAEVRSVDGRLGVVKGILYASLALGGIDSDEYDKLLTRARFLAAALREAEQRRIAESAERYSDGGQITE